MTPEQLDKVREWHRAQATLRQWEVYERGLRDEVVAMAFGEYGDGQRTVDIGHGCSLQNLNVTRWTVKDSAELRALIGNFIQFGNTSEIGKRLIRGKPELSKRAYKELPEWGRALLDEHLTTSRQAPQLQLILPRG